MVCYVFVGVLVVGKGDQFLLEEQQNAEKVSEVDQWCQTAAVEEHKTVKKVRYIIIE